MTDMLYLEIWLEFKMMFCGSEQWVIEKNGNHVRTWISWPRAGSSLYVINKW